MKTPPDSRSTELGRVLRTASIKRVGIFSPLARVDWRDVSGDFARAGLESGPAHGVAAGGEPRLDFRAIP